MASGWRTRGVPKGWWRRRKLALAPKGKMYKCMYTVGLRFSLIKHYKCKENRMKLTGMSCHETCVHTGLLKKEIHTSC